MQANQGQTIEQTIEEPEIETSMKPVIADTDILNKEFILGCKLINKVSDQINQNMYRNLMMDQYLNNNDHRIIQIFLSLLFTVKDATDAIVVSTWTDATEILEKSPQEIHTMQSNFASMIKTQNFNCEITGRFREAFVEESLYDPKNYIVNHIKEYLCEAFCLIDIIREIQQLDKSIDDIKIPEIETTQNYTGVPEVNLHSNIEQQVMYEIKHDNGLNTLSEMTEPKTMTESQSCDQVVDIRSKYKEEPEEEYKVFQPQPLKLQSKKSKMTSSTKNLKTKAKQNYLK